VENLPSSLKEERFEPHAFALLTLAVSSFASPVIAWRPFVPDARAGYVVALLAP
jgi:hypothetical protein